MKRLCVALLVMGCGADGLAHFEMSFHALALPVGEFQVAVITERANVDCTAVMKGCVKGAFPLSRFVDLQDSKGATSKGVRFGADAGISVSLAPQRDLAFVLEALSGESPPRLMASSCKYVENITAGENKIDMTITLKADGGVTSDCDPRL